MRDMGVNRPLRISAPRYVITTAQEGITLGWVYEEADAHKMAAAEDMYEALEACRDAMRADNPADGWKEIIEFADAALEKARGES